MQGVHLGQRLEEMRSGAVEALRVPIDAIYVMPEDKGHAVEIVGELGALLQLACNSKNAASIGEAARSIKLVAGTRSQFYLLFAVQGLRPRLASVSGGIA